MSLDFIEQSIIIQWKEKEDPNPGSSKSESDQPRYFPCHRRGGILICKCDPRGPRYITNEVSNECQMTLAHSVHLSLTPPSVPWSSVSRSEEKFFSAVNHHRSFTEAWQHFCPVTPPSVPHFYPSSLSRPLCDAKTINSLTLRLRTSCCKSMLWSRSSEAIVRILWLEFFT